MNNIIKYFLILKNNLRKKILLLLKLTKFRRVSVKNQAETENI